MPKDPAFLFYSQDFLTGTLIMSFEDRGKYITLMAYIQQNGHISEETIRLLVGSFSDTLRLKFKIDKDGLFFNERLDKEIENRRNFVESRQLNGKKGGRPKIDKPLAKPIGKPNGKPNGKPIGKPTTKLLEDEDEDVLSYLNKKEIEQKKLFEKLLNFGKATTNFRLLKESHKISDTQISDFFKRFFDEKIDLGELKNKSESEIIKHFAMWLPKIINLPAPKQIPSTTRTVQY